MSFFLQKYCFIDSFSGYRYIFIITPKQQTVDIIIQYNTTQHNHHESRKELIYTVINQIKIWA